jgi:hypothetical protein
VKKTKEYVRSGKISSLILIVFFLFVSQEVAYSQNIRLLSPNGGERWAIGEEKDITWNYWNFPTRERVALELFHRGRLIGAIGSHIPIAPQGGDVTGPQGRAARWTWKVGNYEGGTAAMGSGYRIRIRTMSVGLNRIYYDQSDREFTFFAKARERPKPKLYQRTPPMVKGRLPDFKIRDVRHNYRHKKVVVYFDGGVGLYKGPLVFNVIVRNSNVIINRRNMVFGDNALEVFSLDLAWPGPQTPYLNVSVKINPDCQIKELNCNNNLYEGRIFENTTDFKLLGEGQCYPRKSIRWPTDRKVCDGAWFNWTESDVKNAIQRGEFRYYDPYDPNTNTLHGTAKVWIGNFSRDQRTAHVTFRFVSYNGVRTVERHMPFMPGERKFVEAGIMLNLQRENFIEARVDSRSSVQRVRINTRFLGLPYDLD